MLSVKEDTDKVRAKTFENLTMQNLFQPSLVKSLKTCNLISLLTIKTYLVFPLCLLFKSFNTIYLRSYLTFKYTFRKTNISAHLDVLIWMGERREWICVFKDAFQRCACYSTCSKDGSIKAQQWQTLLKDMYLLSNQ